ncbi:MAG: ABC transporter permease [Chitinophagaceae bacterium]
MLSNYFRIAWRSLARSKAYTIINILGLTAGMAVALLIGLWVWDEISFDNYHQHHSRLAQVMDVQVTDGEASTSGNIAIPLADELRTRYAGEFKRVAIVFPAFTHTVAVGDKKISQPGSWVQPDLPEMLSLKMIEGRRDALKDPSSVLITASLAKALFGSEPALNKTLRLDNRAEITIAGVFEDLPANTTFHDTKLFLSWSKAITLLPWLKDAQSQWDNRYWQLYVELNEHADIAKVNKQIKDVVKPHIKASNEELFLHPMDKWHLYNEFRNGKAAGGRIRLVWLFGITGIMVLILACINFMNLSTARSEKRAKETGIRKAIGAARGQLIARFLGESMLLSILSFVAAIVLVQCMLPFFRGLTGKEVTIPYTAPWFWILMLLFTLFTGLIAGSYPAFYLSSFHPVKVLKGSFRTGRLAALPRKALLVVQFTVSMMLIVGTIVVYKQIQYAKSRPAGYMREGLITITMNTPEIYGIDYNVLRNELLQSGAVAAISKSSVPSTAAPFSYNDLTWKGKDPGTAPLIGLVTVTHDFGNTVNWQVSEGRDFSRAYAADTGSLIINEAAAKLMGFKDPVGESISFDGKPHIVTGVIKNMLMESPYTAAQPTVFWLQYNNSLNALSVRMNPVMPVQESLSKIETVFKKLNPGGSFEYKFTDQEYARKFSDEERVGKLATVFAVLAIFICSLGVLGLASFMAEQRTKEIGIRKVLGASVVQLLILLSKDFIKLVVIALLVATPIVWYIMFNWLQHYPYHTAMPLSIFVLAGAGVLLITLLTVSYQSVKAAMMNPVESLKKEGL